jgi:hypothetical protein
MRILMTGVALVSMLLFSGCAMPANSALHAYPSFGTMGGGRLIVFQRSTTGSLVPAASATADKRSTRADTEVR